MNRWREGGGRGEGGGCCLPGRTCQGCAVQAQRECSRHSFRAGAGGPASRPPPTHLCGLRHRLPLLGARAGRLVGAERLQGAGRGTRVCDVGLVSEGAPAAGPAEHLEGARAASQPSRPAQGPATPQDRLLSRLQEGAKVEPQREHARQRLAGVRVACGGRAGAGAGGGRCQCLLCLLPTRPRNIPAGTGSKPLQLQPPRLQAD